MIRRIWLFSSSWWVFKLRKKLTLSRRRSKPNETRRNRRFSGRSWLRFYRLKNCLSGGRWTRVSWATTKCWLSARTWSRRPDSWTSRTRSWRRFWTNTCRLALIRSCKCRRHKSSDLTSERKTAVSLSSAQINYLFNWMIKILLLLVNDAFS